MRRSIKSWVLARSPASAVALAGDPSYRALSIPSRWRFRLLLSTILLAALALRLSNVGWGLPYAIHPDEPIVADAALGMVRRGDWNPRFFDYPSLYLYALRVVFSAHWRYGLATGLYVSAAQFPLTTRLYITAPGFFIWGRALTSLLGALIVVPLGLVGRRWWGPRAGIAAAAMAAVLPMLVRNSQFITVDIPATLATLLALGASLRLLESGDLRDYTLAGLAAGVAAATKYNAGAVVLAIAAAHMIGLGRAGLRRPWRLVWAALCSMIAFLLCTPYALLTPQSFVSGIQRQYADYAAATRGDLLGRWPVVGYLRFFWATGLGPLPGLAALIGGVVVAVRHDRAGKVLVLFALPYLLFFLSWPQHFFRNLLPIFPVLALLAGIGADAVALALASGFEWLHRRSAGERHGWANTLAMPIVLAAAIVNPLSIAIVNDRLSVPASPLIRLGADVLYHLPRGERAAVELPAWEWASDPAIVAARSVTEHSEGWYRAQGFRYLVADPRYHMAADRSAYARLRGAANRVLVLKAGGVYLEVLDLGVHPEAIAMQARRADFGDRVRLLGYAIGAGRGPRMQLSGIAPARLLHPGQWLLLNLYLQAHRHVGYNDALTLDLVDPSGGVVARRSAIIRDRDYPSSRWQVGELVIEAADLQLPSDLRRGVYHIAVTIDPAGQADRSLSAPNVRPSFVLAGIAVAP
jgi:4-amino-4-deoxy-L-arabinose transferase-like glycosyltransferase